MIYLSFVCIIYLWLKSQKKSIREFITHMVKLRSICVKWEIYETMECLLLMLDILNTKTSRYFMVYLFTVVVCVCVCMERMAREWQPVMW